MRQNRNGREIFQAGGNGLKVLGITGGVGSGKSQVLAYLESEYQAVVCQMDEVAKQLQKKGRRATGRFSGSSEQRLQGRTVRLTESGWERPYFPMPEN